jgi:predicted outer membrane repeat protein
MAGSPYLVEGDITIPSGELLVVEPGVEVIFQSWYKLTVNGVLLAEGTAADPIVFTEVGASPGWLGIRFVDSDPGSSMSYCIVERGRATGASPFDTGGGIYIANSDPTISHSTIRSNYAKRRGGGIFMTGSNAMLVANTITNNSTGQGASASGGGLYITNSNPEITGNAITDNSVYVSGSFSTPTGAGGGLVINSSDPVLRSNLIANNSVTGHLNSHARGGGVYLYYSDAAFVGCTFAGNTSNDEGGAIYSYQSNPVFVNSILWGDAPSAITGSHLGWQSEFTVAYSDLEGGQSAIVTNDNATINWLDGNIALDPLFVDPVGGDYSLDAASPAVDAGTDYFEWNGQVLVNLAPGQYSGDAPDMGAFELTTASGGNQPPVAVASLAARLDRESLTVHFSSDGSYDPDGEIAAYSWDFGDGSSSKAANPVHRYRRDGTYVVTLKVADDLGATASDSLRVTVPFGSLGGGIDDQIDDFEADERTRPRP